jgi:Cu-processing system ATP-binding protein
VDGVTLTLSAGERLALLGHNGAGKTTLMKLMLGLIRPGGGEVRVLGGDPAVRGAARTRLEVGFLPENVAFHEAMTGLELLRFYARLKECPPGVCAALLERVGLQESARSPVRTYSKGMRQRLGLAQALLGAPRLLLLDEPTTGMDPALRQSFYAIIRGLKESGTSVLLSSHLLTELEERTDRIAIMDRGRLVAAGPLAELRRRARLPVRLRLTVTEGCSAEVLRRLGRRDGIRSDDSAVTFACPPEGKMVAIREIAALGALVRDVDIVPPSLNDVYASLTGPEAAE